MLEFNPLYYSTWKCFSNPARFTYPAYPNPMGMPFNVNGIQGAIPGSYYAPGMNFGSYPSQFAIPNIQIPPQVVTGNLIPGEIPVCQYDDKSSLDSLLHPPIDLKEGEDYIVLEDSNNE